MDEIEFLQALLSIPSPSGQEDAVAGFLLEQMRALGFRAGRDEAGNVVGALGDPTAKRAIVLLGHMDTVPGDIPVREVGGRLYGRGAVDAKGALAAFVLAAARTAPRLDNAQIWVIGAVEEELHGRGARHLARTLPPPTCAIVGEPSHWEGLTLGYKGMLSLDYRLTQACEHSAGQGRGPAEKAVGFWNRLMDYAGAFNAGRSDGFDTLDPALREFNTFSDGLHEGVDLGVVMRLPPGLSVVELETNIRAWCNGATLKFYPSDPPFQAVKNTPLVRAMLRAIRACSGKPRFKLKTGTSDMNIVGPAWGCPIVAYGPGDSALDHTPDEHIHLEEFHRAVEVLAQALQSLVV